jgi:hypothetical protein
MEGKRWEGSMLGAILVDEGICIRIGGVVIIGWICCGF